MENSELKQLLVAILILCAGLVQAEEVKLTMGDLTLNANLEKADGNWPQGPVVLMTHGTLAHNGMEIMTTLQELFKESGISSLALTLGLGLSDRHGMYDCAVKHTHHHTDSLDEIGLWLDWLKKEGAEKVVLLGHSRGGNQTAWFAAERDDASIQGVILIAPQVWDEAAEASGYEAKYGKPLAPILAAANKSVEAAQGDTFIEKVDFIYCNETSATASAFASYYNPDQRMDTPYLVAKIAKPVMVFAGSNDDVVAGLTEKMTPLAEQESVTFEVIDGADHYFRDLYAEDVVEMAVEFMGQ